MRKLGSDATPMKSNSLDRRRVTDPSLLQRPFSLLWSFQNPDPFGKKTIAAFPVSSQSWKRGYYHKRMKTFIQSSQTCRAITGRYVGSLCDYRVEQ